MEDLVDDPTIRDNFRLLRRIPAEFNRYIVWNHNVGEWRISSMAFADHPSGSPMSVQIKEVLAEYGLGVESVLVGHEQGYAVAYFCAGEARELGQAIERDPIDGDPAHAHVVGKKTKSIKKKFSRLARWEIPPAEFPSPPK